MLCRPTPLPVRGAAAVQLRGQADMPEVVGSARERRCLLYRGECRLGCFRQARRSVIVGSSPPRTPPTNGRRALCRAWRCGAASTEGHGCRGSRPEAHDSPSRSLPSSRVTRPRWLVRVGGYLPESLLQAGEMADHAVNASDREDSQDIRAGDHQP